MSEVQTSKHRCFKTCFCYYFAWRRNFFSQLSRNLALHETYLLIMPENPILYKSICSRVGCPVWNIFDTLSNTEPHLKTRYCQVTYRNIQMYVVVFSTSVGCYCEDSDIVPHLFRVPFILPFPHFCMLSHLYIFYAWRREYEGKLNLTCNLRR